MPNHKKSKSGRTRGRREEVRVDGRSIPRPPPFVPTLSLEHVFRFQNGSNSGNFDITRAMLLNLLQVSTSNTVSYRAFNAVRLVRVELWSNPTALGAAPNEIALQWNSPYAPSTEMTDESMGIVPAHIRASPPKDASSRWWCLTGFNETDKVFKITVAANCIIEVTLELRSYDSNDTAVVGDGASALNTGFWYGGYLDGRTSGKLSSIGYTPIS